MEGNSVIPTESSKCAFAETKAKFYEKSSLHSDQKRIKKENKKKEKQRFNNTKFLINLLVLDVLNFAIHEFRVLMAGWHH